MAPLEWILHPRRVRDDPPHSVIRRRARPLPQSVPRLLRGTEWDARADLREIVANQWSRVLCAKPQATWLRRFGSHIGSALHLKGSPNLRPFIKSWLKACDNVDPEAETKAATPQLLRAMFEQSGAGTIDRRDTREAVIAEIAIAAYFFAMRSCEITETATPGRTKIIRLEGVVFRDSKHREIPHTSKQDLGTARRVTVTFENQKNGLKMDKRTQERTGTA
ncbi:hypothetical protein MHU86_17906 [Fragilaria crotonensis]|nr:hypothetical protein MHU86_17906 [Fragilaria crotonensis]